MSEKHDLSFLNFFFTKKGRLKKESIELLLKKDRKKHAKKEADLVSLYIKKSIFMLLKIGLRKNGEEDFGNYSLIFRKFLSIFSFCLERIQFISETL